MLLYGQDEAVARFVETHIPSIHGRSLPRPCKAIGIMKDQRIVGGFVYHDWNPEAGVIEMSCAATDKRWFSRETLYAFHEYPFMQLDCQMVASRVSQHNLPLIRQKLAFGYTPHRIPRLFGRSDDGIIFTLTIEQWAESPFTKSYLKRFESHGKT